MTLASWKSSTPKASTIGTSPCRTRLGGNAYTPSMFLRQLDLSTALRPSLYDDEVLLHVQDGVGLYEGKFKIPNYQNGHAYLTSHRICYVDNVEPRKYSVAVDLKEIEKTEFYAGFLKSSAKITLFPKPSKRHSQAIRSPVPRYASPAGALVSSHPSTPRSVGQSPAPARDVNATWICPICGFSNAVPGNFDPSTANQYTTLPACQACGINPPLVHMVKAAISAMSNRPAASSNIQQSERLSLGPETFVAHTPNGTDLPAGQCPRCTFQNHPSLHTCEICGASLQTSSVAADTQNNPTPRPESPGPSLGKSIVGDDTIETIKLSFRLSGEKPFYEKAKGALVQRKWLLQSAPPIPRPNASPMSGSPSPFQPPDGMSRATPSQQRVVGIAGLERRGAELRENAQAVIGTAFEDLEALMASAKEVIAMAEQFQRQMDNGSESAEARAIINDSASALGLITTKDMLGTGSSSETTYITELARDLAEFLTDDRRGILRKEGGIMSLVDLWAVFNRTRNGIELISPLDFERAAAMWESLHLPIRLRRFKSGLLVVQEKSRTDEKTIASLLSWLRQLTFSATDIDPAATLHNFGRGATAQEIAERFGWSVGVATEELEMAEEAGALCRDQGLGGISFWENHLMTFDPPKQWQDDAVKRLSGLVV